MEFFKSLTTGGKIFFGVAIVALVVGGLYFGHNYAVKNKVFDKAHDKVVDSKFKVNEDADLVLAYNTFPGMQGILLMNGGMEPNEESQLYKDYGVKLQIKQMDVSSDVQAGITAGALDMAYCTVDAYPISMSSSSSFVEDGTKVRFKVNESRGADAIVAIKSITKVSDLKGKKVAYAVGTASHTLLINVLETAGLKMSDIDAYKVADGVEAANAFKNGQCDAALVWAPDDEDCVIAIDGAHVLVSTETATQIIADGLIINDKVAKEKHDLIYKVLKAWLVGNAKINNSSASKKEANSLFAAGFNFPEEITAKSTGKIRFCTLEDNKKFFGFDATYTGVTGEKMYSRMAVKYTEAGLAKSPAAWRLASDGSFIDELLKDPELVKAIDQGSEQPVTFAAPTKADYVVPAQSDKVVTLTFATNSSTLDEQAIAIINREVTGSAQGFEKARIRVEGNTDNVGSNATNKPLSLRRAQAVVDYLVSEYKFNRNKFIVVGNGSTKPVKGCEANQDEGCRSANRRTDFQFIW